MSKSIQKAARSGSLRSAVRFDARAPVIAQVVSNEATNVFVVCLDPGQELRRHRAPAELTLLVIEGEPVISVGDRPYATTRGHVLLVASGAFHALSAGSRRAVVVGILNQTEPRKVPERERQQTMPKPTITSSVDRLEVLEDDAIDSNPDAQTRRETFELELMEEGRSNEGALADLAHEAEHKPSRKHGKAL